MHLEFRYPKLITFDAESVWDGKTGGTATISHGRKIIFDTPETFGGFGQGMCPDELFVSAILGCLNNTFLDFQRRFDIELVLMHLQGKATVKFDGTGDGLVVAHGGYCVKAIISGYPFSDYYIRIHHTDSQQSDWIVE